MGSLPNESVQSDMDGGVFNKLWLIIEPINKAPIHRGGHDSFIFLLPVGRIPRNRRKMLLGHTHQIYIRAMNDRPPRTI